VDILKPVAAETTRAEAQTGLHLTESDLTAA
jgi:hypothetical protein